MTRAEVRMFVAAVARVDAQALYYDTPPLRRHEVVPRVHQLEDLADELDDEVDAMGLTPDLRHEAWERFFRP